MRGVARADSESRDHRECPRPRDVKYEVYITLRRAFVSVSGFAPSNP